MADRPDVAGTGGAHAEQDRVVAGAGVATRVQLVPFQCTDTVAWGLLVSVNPAAQTLAGLIAAAPAAPLVPALVMPGEGTAITVQRVPSQCHARFLLW